MVKPTAILTDEHRVIEQVLNCLERMAERCESEGKLDPAPAGDALSFLRAFAERCHYGKEERELLPAVQARKAELDRCAGCAVLHRHEESRAHLDAMEQALQAGSAGDPAASRQFAEHARDYIDLLLEYIAGEEDCLFPMVDRVLSEKEQTELGAALVKPGSRSDGDCPCLTYVDVANRLADRLGVPRAVLRDR